MVPGVLLLREACVVNKAHNLQVHPQASNKQQSGSKPMAMGAGSQG